MKEVKTKFTKKDIKKESSRDIKSKEKSIFKKILKTITNGNLYYSFNMRVAVNTLALMVLIFGLMYSAVVSFSITKKQFINYKEHSDIDYKIYLKDNSFYDEKYLGKGMVYVASLIDKIHINFLYNLDIDKMSSLDIKYKVKAKLIVASQSNSNTFFEKEYDLSKEETDELIAGYGYSIDKKDVVIDYNYYNNLANSFRSKYGVNTDSRLEVTLFVDEKSKEDNFFDFANSNEVTLVIPLSQQEVNITFDNKNINDEKQLISDSKFVIKDVRYTIIFCLVLFLIVVSVRSLLHKISLMNDDESKYDRFVNRLLRGYDRIIISIKTVPNFNDYSVIEVDDFQELIDVRDNTSQPINYYVITAHHKCEFFVINKHHLYLYVIKSADFDGENLDEKERGK